MRRLLARVLLVLLFVSAGGVVVAEDPAAAGGTVLSQFSLVALIEAHDPGADLSMEHHPVCTDCTGLAAVVGVIGLIALAYPLVTAHATVQREAFMTSTLVFSPPAPPPR